MIVYIMNVLAQPIPKYPPSQSKGPHTHSTPDPLVLGWVRYLGMGWAGKLMKHTTIHIIFHRRSILL